MTHCSEGGSSRPLASGGTSRMIGGSSLLADDGVEVGYVASRGRGGPLELGSSARLRSGTVLYTGSRIGHRFQTGHGTVVREDCDIGDDVAVWGGTVVDYACSLGDRVKIHANCYIAQYSQIDQDAFLAPGVSLANDLFPGDELSARLMLGPHIGAGAQLGVNVTVLPFVRIGAGCVVGAGSVVTRDLPDGSLAYGNPARIAGRSGSAREVLLGRLSGDHALRARFGDRGSLLDAEAADEHGA